MERRNFLKIMLAGCIAPAVIPVGNLMKLNTGIIKASNADVEKYANPLKYAKDLQDEINATHSKILHLKLGDIIEKKDWVGVITEIRKSEQVIARNIKPTATSQEIVRVINNPEETYRLLGDPYGRSVNPGIR